jgi:hypothetical protein
MSYNSNLNDVISLNPNPNPNSSSNTKTILLRNFKDMNLTEKKEYLLSSNGISFVLGLLRDGLSITSIAEKLIVKESWLNTLRREYPHFNSVFNYSREVVIQNVENSLVKRAMGYNTTIKKPMIVEETAFDKVSGRMISKKQKVVYVEEEQHIVPDTKAITFFLENMKPQQYRSNAQQLISEINQEHHEKIAMVNESLLDAINSLVKTDSGIIEEQPLVVADAMILDKVDD